MHVASRCLFFLTLCGLLAAGEKPPPASSGKPKEAASTNLALPSDLPDGARKSIEEAIAAIMEAGRARAGQDKLYRRAIDKLRLASQKAPRSAVPFYYLGLAYQVKKNFTEAKKALEKAVELQPTFHEALCELGDVHGWRKDYQKALELYDQALEIDPKYLPAIQNKTMAHIRLGQLKEAQPCLERAMKLAPGKELKRLQRQLEVEIEGPPWEKTYRAEGENYNIITPVSQEFADEILKRAELIRRAYNKVFPQIEKPKRKYQVWVFQDAGEYHRTGGPMNAGGHYDPVFRKLALYRYPKQEKTFEVLNHEAFHQYLHDYVEAAPQWFNEGLGDYFGAFQYVKAGKSEKMLPRPNLDRFYFIKSVMDTPSFRPAAELMAMTQAEMYDELTMSQNYAQAWAIIYFIMEGQKPQYQKTLVSYFKTLQKGQDPGEAYSATFGKLDMARFDQEWKSFIGSVKAR
jgi:tetratricopeptide (TPR) repeat protein